MLITVAICTYNRASSLRRTLDALAAMEVPSDAAWELVIVNNNSTDDTDEVISKYRDRLPVRAEFERQPGQSNARNHAIGAARGDYILWTDDDVVVEPGWLSAYRDAFCRWPGAAVFGGRIIPRLEPPVPKWIAESIAVLGGPYAARDFGDQVQPLSIAEDRLPFGANFAVRAREQRAFQYNPNLGLTPNRRRLGDETDVITRILEAGGGGYWLPTAIVNHYIGRERQSIRYIANFCEGWAESEAYRTAASGLRRTGWPVKAWLRYRFHRVMSPAPIWVKSLQEYACAKGTNRYRRQRTAELGSVEGSGSSARVANHSSARNDDTITKINDD